MYSVGGRIDLQDLLQQFITKVGNLAMAEATYSSDNPSGTPVDIYMDSRASLSLYPSQGVGVNRFGREMQPIKAGSVYDTSGYDSIYAALTHLTKILLKIGGWSYRNACTGAYDNTTTGTAIFNNSVLFQAYSVNGVDGINMTLPSRQQATPMQPLSITTFETLFNDCINTWRSTSKPFVRIVNITCHSDCHSNHSDECHTNGIDPSYCNEWMNPYKPYTPGQSYGCNECNCYVNGDHVYGIASGTHQNVPGGGHTNSSGGGGGCHTNTIEIFLQ